MIKLLKCTRRHKTKVAGGRGRGGMRDRREGKRGGMREGRRERRGREKGGRKRGKGREEEEGGRKGEGEKVGKK